MQEANQPFNKLTSDYYGSSDEADFIEAVQPVPRVIKPRYWNNKSALTIVAVALSMGLAAQFLFYGNMLGISVVGFTILALACLFGLGLREKVKARRRNLWLLPPLLFFAAMVGLRANVTLTIINLIMVIILFSLIVFFYHSDEVARLSLLDYPIILFLFGGSSMLAGGPVVMTVAENTHTPRKFWQVSGAILRGLVIATPILVVFIYLFSSADSIFEKFTVDALKFNFFKDLPDLTLRLGFVLVVAWFVVGWLAYGLAQRSNEVINIFRFIPQARKLNQAVGFVEIVTVLGLVTLLFGFFDLIQFNNLFAGQAASKMSLYDYQTYARRGFGELLVAAILALVLILGLNWLVRCQTERQSQLIKTLSTILIGLLGVILVSAYLRMLAWENVEYYLDTGLRVYVRNFIIWLGIGFGWLAITLWWKPQRFSIGAFIALIGFVATINIINPDVDAVKDNLPRFENNQQYNARNIITPGLTEDAIIPLVEHLKSTKNPKMKEFLQVYLTGEFKRLERLQTNQGWPAFHFSRQQAYEVLRDLNQQGYLKIGSS